MLAAPRELTSVIVSLALTVFGLFLVSFLIGLGTDVVRELMMLTRRRPPGYRGHTVIVNMGPATRQLLLEIMRFYRKLLPEGRFSVAWFREFLDNARRGLTGQRFVVLGIHDEAPDFLRTPELARVTYRQGHSGQERSLRRADVTDAKRVVLLADLESEEPDAETIQGLVNILERRRERNSKERPQLVLAEILNESNVPAARAAVFAGGPGLSVSIVPTERLLALFIACVARRPGIGRLLEELLTSHGSELYTWSMDDDRHGRSAWKNVCASAASLVHRLREVGMMGHAREWVVPVGLLERTPAEPGLPQVRVCLNPTDERNTYTETDFCGFVGLASNYWVVLDFVQELDRPEIVTNGQDDAAQRSPELEALPFVRGRTTPLHRVVVVGFRPATVSLIEALLAAQDDAQILLLVSDNDELERVQSSVQEHNECVNVGILEGRHREFVPRGDRVWSLGRRGTVQVAVCDVDRLKVLRDLPEAFGSIVTVDLVLFISNEHESSDARTTQLLMKIESLRIAAGRHVRGPRVIAELLDASLAKRLRHRFAELHADEVRVYSIQELRAYFMFQSLVVPHFETVYSELLGPWGQSFVRLKLAQPQSGHVRIQAFAQYLYSLGWTLIAVEAKADALPEGGVLWPGPLPGRGGRLFVGRGTSNGGNDIDLAELESIWVIASDQDGSASASMESDVSLDSSSVSDCVERRKS